MARVNQSCLNADIWLRAYIHYLTDQKVNIKTVIRERVARGWYEDGMGSPLYTKHKVKY